MNTVRGLSKSESKNALSLSTKEIYFIFNKLLYTQIDSVAMGSPPTSAIAFLCFYEIKNGLYQCPHEFKLVGYIRFVDNIYLWSVLLINPQKHNKSS